MSIINPVILFSSSLVLIFWLRKAVSAKIQKASVAYRKACSEKDMLAADQAILATETGRLKRGLEETVELYEITREITGSLEQDKVFEIFKDKINKFLRLKDCRFLKSDEKPGADPDWTLFSLGIGKKSLGSLAVKQIKESDVEKFRILAQQFLLGLKRAVLYQHVQEMATLDGLTKVFTRGYWSQRCKDELERSTKFGYPLSCLMIDVDKFKDLNDTYGHLVGDAILAEVSAMIKENIRQIDLLGKYGGEEFSLILTETDIQGAVFVAERIRQAVEGACVKAYDESLKVTISIGVAVFPADSRDLLNLVDKADQALYRAKETGRNRVCVFKSQD